VDSVSRIAIAMQTADTLFRGNQKQFAECVKNTVPKFSGAKVKEKRKNLA
jgi:hypothetical protein